MTEPRIDPVVAALLVAVLTRQPLVFDAPAPVPASKGTAAARPARVAQRRAPRPTRKG